MNADCMVNCEICGEGHDKKSMQKFTMDPLRKRGFMPVCNDCYYNNTDDELIDKLIILSVPEIDRAEVSKKFEIMVCSSCGSSEGIGHPITLKEYRENRDE